MLLKKIKSRNSHKNQKNPVVHHVDLIIIAIRHAFKKDKFKKFSQKSKNPVVHHVALIIIAIRSL